jgi:hypothetical protein
MNIFIAFIIGIVCGVILCALSDCLYKYGKQVGRESARAEAEAGERERREVECCGGAHPPPHRAEDPYVLLRCWRACMAGTRPSDWELIVSHLLIDTDAALAHAASPAWETETGDTQGRAEGVYTAGVDVLAIGYSIEVCLRRRAPERREVTRGRKFSSFFRKS